MAVFKCKMCGGDLEIQGESVAVCSYCQTRQTLPRLESDRKAQLYDRANHFRRSNDFDKAMGIYEQILNEDNTDAEAYWSLVLCRYGIEYVEDPASRKRIPTVNRIQYTSVLADPDYEAALQYADGAQRILYEEEAQAIDSIQKGFLAISQKEEPFDVFICYKETDPQGKRTHDSVLAQQLYYELTEAGYKVFFSRITLENQLGSAYEPYIFAALNSAKVMVVVGTKPEYFNAVWVKNEWSRYLAMIRKGEKKQLIPAYRDMDPYDMPEEFSYLQSQDMSKLGFLQDLIRGIEKIIGPKTAAVPAVAEAPAVVAGGATVATLLKRASIFLEDRDFSSADEYCEKVLDMDPENAEAYLYKLLCDLRLSRKEQLEDCIEDFWENKNYRKAYQFGDDWMKGFLSRVRDAARVEPLPPIPQDSENVRRAITNGIAEVEDCRTVIKNANMSKAKIAEQLNQLQRQASQQRYDIQMIEKKARNVRIGALLAVVGFFFGFPFSVVGIYMMLTNDIAKKHSTGDCVKAILLSLVTCGIYNLFLGLRYLKNSSQSVVDNLKANLNRSEQAAAQYARQLSEVCELIRQKEARIKELTGA